MSLPPWLVATGVRFVFKKFRERIARRTLSVAKGKLTYASIAALILPVLSAWLGFEIIPADIEPVWQGVTAAIALFGKWRASRNYGVVE
jgi:hypothetical protein